MNEILVPSIIPNNLMIIRKCRRKSIDEFADTLQIDKPFLNTVEKNVKNFSGKLTIKSLYLFKITFNMLYDIKSRVILPVERPYSTTERFTISIPNTCNYTEEEILSNRKYEKEILLTLKHKENLNESDIIFNLEYNTVTIKDCNVILDVVVDIKTKQIYNEEFDINFTKNINWDLEEKLTNHGFFSDTISIIEREVDGINIKFDGDLIILDQNYKIFSDFDKTWNESNILNRFDVEVKEVNKRAGKPPVHIVRFKALRPAINNMKYLRELLGYTPKEVAAALGIGLNSYTNLELGNQKLSTKLMWKLVKLYNVPLENIINIDEYYFRYCLFGSRIEK